MLNFSISFLKSHFHNQVTYFFVGIGMTVEYPQTRKKKKRNRILKSMVSLIETENYISGFQVAIKTVL